MGIKELRIMKKNCALIPVELHKPAHLPRFPSSRDGHTRHVESLESLRVYVEYIRGRVS